MLAFSAGELSTQTASLGCVSGKQHVQQFNPADFPCPPPSIMVKEFPDEEMMYLLTSIPTVPELVHTITRRTISAILRLS